MAEHFSTDLLVEMVTAHMSAESSRLVFEPIRSGKHNTSYYVLGAGQDMVLRISPPDDAGLLFYERRMMAQEPAIHSLLRAETNIPVAEILVYDESRSLVDRDYVLMQRLPGRPMSDVQLSKDQLDAVLQQVGVHLAEMHTLVANRYGYLGTHHTMTPQPTWTAAFVVMWDKLLDDIVASGGYTQEEADALSHLLTVYRPFFERDIPASLLHMDVWGQNILVDEASRVTGLVDLDRALWGDPEIEYAVLDYCGISEPAFWQGYGRVRDTSFPAQIRARFYTLYEVQKYIPIHIWRRHDLDGALAYKRKSFALVSPLLQALAQ